MDQKTIELAIALHGHLAPGIALGLRMTDLALSRLDRKKGDKHLIGISETARCLADAMQAATGCTLGHGNAFVEDQGKLAITIGDAITGRGVRVGLRENAATFSGLMYKWMMRSGKLTHAEEEELGNQLLNLNEEFLRFQDVKICRKPDFEKSTIVKCERCGELIPESLTVKEDEKFFCRACTGDVYFRLLDEQENIYYDFHNHSNSIYFRRTNIWKDVSHK
ncbi:MAG TPA: FmdE family protein [Candidatus Methanoperedens sp.]